MKLRLKMIQTLYFHEIKALLRGRRILLLGAILAFIAYSTFVTGFLQVLFLLYFKRSVHVSFPLSITFYLLLLLLPFLCALAGHDIFRKEKDGGQLRMLAAKVPRLHILAGKFLALWTMICALCIAMMAFALLYSQIWLRSGRTFDAIAFMLLLCVYASSASALTVLFSIILKNAILWILLVQIFLMASGKLSLVELATPSLAILTASISMTLIFLALSAAILWRADL